MADKICAVCSKTAGTKRCSQCLSTRYCSSECQLADWRKHKRVCTPATVTVASSEPEAAPEGIDEEVVRMRAYLAEIRKISDKYLEGARPARRGGPTSVPDVKLLDEARVKLAEFKVSPGFGFTPAPSASQQTLLSMIRTFWLWTVARLTPEERERMAFMLNNTPPFGKRVPKFDGKRIVGQPGSCSAREYEGLLRCCPMLVFQIPGKLDSEEATLWREAAEVMVIVWEED